MGDLDNDFSLPEGEKSNEVGERISSYHGDSFIDLKTVLSGGLLAPDLHSSEGNTAISCNFMSSEADTRKEVISESK